MTNTFKYIILGIAYMATVMVVGSCSSTSSVPDGDKLFTGLTKIEYKNHDNSDHFTTTQEEVEAALATQPNGSLLGSSYYHTAFPLRLWIWNAFSQDSSKLSRWITKSFGRAPVLMSRVNPALRSSVAAQVLRNHGYFRGQVAYKEVEQSNPKKAKIGYTVNAGHLFTIDSLSYVGFPETADSMLLATKNQALVHKGDPFDVSTLDAERTRITSLFRNNGYFYYQPSYSIYLADTVSTPGKVGMKFHFDDKVNEKVRHKWYIGNVNIELKKQFLEIPNDSIHYRRFSVFFHGRRSPIRPRVIYSDLKLRHGQLYSYDKYMESANLIAAKGIFSMTDFKFTPRDTTSTCDSLDMKVSCVFDKPYQLYVETNAKGKTTGRMGPEFVLGFTKLNAFRGGEKLDINMHGSYEWQTGHKAEGTSSELNSYEYGSDVSLEMPRLLLPFRLHKRFYTTPSTVIKASSNIINRASYFKRHIVSGELTYNFQPTATSLHQFSPLTLEYDYMKNVTDSFQTVMNENPYLLISMQDQFIPKSSYTYTYTSPLTYRSPIYWRLKLSESANLLSLGYMVAGKKWDDRDKKMFKNPYAQFFKIETDYTKTWAMGDHAQLLGHVSGGIIYSYGNSTSAPYSEQFYVGGANSVRAFTVRSIGPGQYHTDKKGLSYIDQTGDIKFLANLEYRSRIFGNLYGAAFLDAGNVWAMRNDYRSGSQFKLSKAFDELAVGTGFGVRYDLSFFVLRIDWGIGLHLPYDTGHSGWYNIPSFKDGQSIHLAIGYPF
jgi:hypothetical protein